MNPPCHPDLEYKAAVLMGLYFTGFAPLVGHDSFGAADLSNPFADFRIAYEGQYQCTRRSQHQHANAVAAPAQQFHGISYSGYASRDFKFNKL